MIIDPQTGKIVLERLSANVRVKNVRMENRTVNPPIKPAVPRANVTESLPDKKPTKPTIATTTTLATATTISKPITQKVTNPSKPIVNAPVKPMPAKRTLSPTDDRLSDEESSPDPSETVAISVSTPAAPVQTNVIPRRSSHTTLEQDLQLSDTSDEEN
ncbi:unnamed protein product [Rotaria magnacalcarata]|nr:unnamed protein product [Rotaria magnacalcarata]